ncbi:MAG: hypothetical protein LKJ22_01020 [Liquorilactobacillus nagelii]|mgnify:CR=1 FL=1|jgi:hypothetical protein|uniref:Phage protein n=1 Tax=Liquorilactobacillus hordei TaxID=468911 RepID=A0A3Q8CXF9_9LACO|nr:MULTISPECIES: hypothetical protein [Liquorilactobacillus]AUJ29632.1 hypothetical protein BSQ49_05110 [Liquorilactobacillus hordei]MCI1920485.1 hypothetical protein [Liquorilactobacillus nagelii]MCI1976129.1 hypothetical protein [Liquorilactobacillus nagelii]
MARLEIKIRNKNGEYKKYEQNWVPTRKMLEALDIGHENYPDLKELNEKQAEFIASVFDEKEVTKDAILDGVAAWEFAPFVDEFLNKLLGVDPNLEAEEQ